MKYLISILGGLLLCSGCQNSSNKSKIAKDNTAVTAKQGSSRYLTPRFDYVQQIPDSLRTPQQQKLAKQLLEISIKHVKVVDHRMVFDMSKKEFRRTGIPMKYYQLFKKNMKINNQYNKKHNINNVEEMLQRYRHNIRKVLKELKEKYNASADTTYFALQPAMIQKAGVEKMELQKGDRYRVNVQLRDRYREKYARATAAAIGTFFALTYHGDILTSGLPLRLPM